MRSAFELQVDADAPAPNDEKTCCICLDMIPNGASVRMPCGHDEFCGQCLVTHLLREVRCPVCRQGGDNEVDDDRDSFISDDDADVRHFHSRKESLKLARKDKKNKNTVKSLSLMASWRKEAKEATANYKILLEKTNDAQKVMHSQLRLYEAKLDAQFTRKYGAIESEIKKLRKKVHMANGHACAIQTRLVRKYENAAA